MGRKWKRKERVFMPFFFSWARMLSAIPAADGIEIILAAVEYSEHGTEPQLTGYKAAIFETMRPNIDASIAEFNAKSAAGTKAANTRYHGAEVTTACDGMRTHATACDGMRSDARYAMDKDTNMDTDMDNSTRARARTRKQSRQAEQWRGFESHEYTDEQLAQIENASRDNGEQE